MEPITDAQRRKLFAVIRELGLTPDHLYCYIHPDTGKDHISDMTKKEASALIDKLEKLKTKGSRAGMATQRQLWKIEQLIKELAWDEKNLNKFIQKYAKIEHVTWLTQDAASSIINGLSSIAKRRNEEAGTLETAVP